MKGGLSIQQCVLKLEKMTIRFKHNRHLDRLDKILNFRADDVAPGPTYLFPDILGLASILAAIIATPVILWLLFKLRRFGWLVGFGIVTLVPFSAIYFLTQEVVWLQVLYLIPLAFLAVYYFFLKQKINDWREPIFINKPGSDYHN